MMDDGQLERAIKKLECVQALLITAENDLLEQAEEHAHNLAIVKTIVQDVQLTMEGPDPEHEECMQCHDRGYILIPRKELPFQLHKCYKCNKYPSMESATGAFKYDQRTEPRKKEDSI